MSSKVIETDFGVYGVVPALSSAMRYYRMEVPLRTMHKLGLANTLTPDQDTDMELANRCMLGSDITHAWRLTEEQGYFYSQMLGNLTPATKPDGTIVCPPALTMDSDDALDWVHPFNSVYSAFGVRNWNGDLLEPGDEILDEKDRVLWKDKGTRGQGGVIFDIERNLRNMHYHYSAARNAKGVTVTCEELAKVYRAAKCENVYVFPNSVIPEDYDFPALQPAPKLRIVWEGGASHMESWLTIRDPLLQVLKENPNVQLILFGTVWPGMQEQIPEGQLEFHGWMDYSAYKMKRSILNAQINLCPLLDMQFTRCKSAIRWYEGSLGPNPEATLAANVGPYKEIVDGESGLLYDTPEEFKQKLELLIKDAELRQRLGENAQKWILANRHAEKTVPALFEWFQEIKAQQRQEALAHV